MTPRETTFSKVHEHQAKLLSKLKLQIVLLGGLLIGVTFVLLVGFLAPPTHVFAIGFRTGHMARIVGNLIFISMLGCVLLGLFFSFSLFQNLRILLEDISKNRHNLKNLLNNLDEGFIVFDRDGIVQPGSTQAAAVLFGQDPTGRRFDEILNLDSDHRRILQEWYNLTFSGTLDFQEMKLLAPQSIQNNGRFLKLDFRPIYKRPETKQLDKIICIASDRSKEKELETLALNEADFVKLAVILLRDRNSVLDFLQETEKAIQEIENHLKKSSFDIAHLLRLSHSVKGGAATFHMNDLRLAANSFESLLEKGKDPGIASLSNHQTNNQIHTALHGMKDAIKTFTVKYSSLIGDAHTFSERSKAIPAAVLVKLGQLLYEHSGMSSATMRFFISEFLMDELQTIFQKYDQAIQDIATSQEKKVHFQIKSQPCRVVLDQYRNLAAAFTHAFTNSVDHGIETAAERIENGKPEIANIRLEIRVESLGVKGQKIVITVLDDGRGIDPKEIRRKALQKQICTTEQIEAMNDDQALQLVFEPRFSTASRTSLLSGRGVGLDVLHYEASKLGGTAKISSEWMKGTRLTVEVPLLEPHFDELLHIQRHTAA